MNSREILARNIKKRMEAGRYSQREICQACGFKQNTFSDWVNGKTYPRIDKIEKMAAFFGCSVPDLVGPDLVVLYDSREAKEAQTQRLINLFQRMPETEKKQLIDYATFLTEKSDDH